MSFDLKRRLYESMPRPAAWLLCQVPFGLLAGRSYRRSLRIGRDLDRADARTLHAYQARLLGRMLRFAADEVPAYEHLRGVVDRHAPHEALREFPLVTKDHLQEDLARYLPRSFDRLPHYTTTTGGTTGNQLTIYLDNDAQAIEMAFMHRQWARVGYTPRMRKATFRGVEFRRADQGVYWQRNPIYNELQLSPFHLSDGTVEDYWEHLAAWRPRYLHGYPSAIATLARALERRGIDAKPLAVRAALLGSEQVYDHQREAIERVFGTRVYSWYGHSERLILGGECEHSAAYHHFPDYGVMELVDGSGQSLEAEGEKGELVGTTVRNRSMPLIRYRTGDSARRIGPSCRCGRAFPRFDQVEGHRGQDAVIGKRGSRMSLAALNMHGAFFDEIVKFQYYQSVPGRMEIRAVVTPAFSPEDREALLAAYARKVADEIEIELVLVADIPLTSRGKWRMLVQEVPEASASG